jgi:asparagine synthetase B (glutamine-hydrolysing)
MQSQGHRVILSGIGGDEITGSGVPTPTLELQDLLTRAHLLTLVRQLNAWGKKMRRRRLSLLWEAVREVFPLTRAGLLDELRFYSCFNSGFVRRNRSALSGYPIRIRLFGPLPSFQDSLAKLEADRRLLAHCYLRPDLLRDARYPYLDRDFLEFMFAIPREQIVRVGQRRSLMKRALVNIVPTELLNRRRKAFVPPDAATDRLLGARGWLEADKFIFSSSLGIIDTKRFAEVARDSEHRQITSRVLKRALTLEAWLRHLAMRRVVAESPSTQKANHFLPRDVKKQARTSSAS